MKFNKNSQQSERLFTCHALLQGAVYLACLLAGLSLFGGVVKAQVDLEVAKSVIESRQSDFYVELIDSKLNVKTRNIKKRRLLDEIARQAGFEIVTTVPLDQWLTLEFERVPLHQAMRRILGEQSFAFRYEPHVSGNGNAIDNRVSVLWVLSEQAQTDQANNQRQIQSVSQSVRGSEYTIRDKSLLDDDRLALFHYAMSSDDKDARLEAVSEIAGLESEQATIVFDLASNYADASVREEAVDALGDMGCDAAILHLKQALLDEESNVRKAAIAAIVSIGSDDAAQALAMALNDKNTSVRKEAVNALGEIGGEAAIQMLQLALMDKERKIREAAAEFLAEMPSKEQ